VLEDALRTVTIMYRLLYLVLVLVDVSSSSLDCSLSTAESDLGAQDAQCSCQDWYGDQEIFRWSDLENLTQTLDVQVRNIILTKCSQLRLVLAPPHPVPLPHIMVKDMNKLVISLSMDMPHLNMSINNVLHVQYMPIDIVIQKSPQNIVMYIALGLSAVLVVVLTIFLSILLWTRICTKNISDSKKVSRAESWRYEASMYVNPPSRHQPVFVPPPPFPDFTLPSTSSRPEAPDSVSSSPLLRPKYNSLAEVDLVRTSLPPIQQERQRQNTPPAYREPVDCIQGRAHTHRNSDGGNSTKSGMLTLPNKYR